MNDFDNQLEQALRIAFRREPAPSGFAQRLEFRLALQTAGATAFHPIQAPAPRPIEIHSVWSPVVRYWQRLFPESSFTHPDPEAHQPFQTLTPGRRSPASIAIAIAAHAAVCSLILLLAMQTRVRSIAPPTQTAAIDLKPWLPTTPRAKQTAAGGGGGGDHDLIDVSKGRLPQLAKQQIAPPQIVRNENPKLAVEPTIVMPKNIPLPNAQMPDLGLPTSTQAQMASNGAGANSGMGSGHHGGLGSGDGSGYGPGSAGGTGGGVYHVGGGVSPPLVLASVDPEYSDEARRSKYTGIVVVALIVDAQGEPQNVHVVRHLGMGLDQKAIEAVRQYKFKPAQYQGKPVPVEVNIEVNFQIY